MKKLMYLFVLSIAALLLASQAHADQVTLFSDDFNDNTFDTSKWVAGASSTGGAPLGNVTEHDGVLDFKINGGYNVWNPESQSYQHYGVVSATSQNIALPHATDSVTLSGLWQMTSAGSNTAGGNIKTFNSDNPNDYIWISYSHYWSKIAMYDSGSLLGEYTRANPSAMSPFILTFTDDGWSFNDNGTIYNFTTTTLPDSETENIKILLGGQDAWYNSSNNEHVYFDDINVTANFRNQAVPEPATMSLLGLGLAGLLKFKRKKA